MKNYHHKPQENKYFVTDDGTYISKVGLYYEAFRADGTMITEAILPINMSIMCFRGMLPVGIKVRPSQEEIDIEPSLKALLDN